MYTTYTQILVVLFKTSYFLIIYERAEFLWSSLPTDMFFEHLKVYSNKEQATEFDGRVKCFVFGFRM